MKNASFTSRENCIFHVSIIIILNRNSDMKNASFTSHENCIFHVSIIIVL